MATTQLPAAEPSRSGGLTAGPAAAIPRGRRGFVLADVLLGIAIVVMLGGILVASAGWSRRAADHAADVRAATTAAEAALVDLATGRPAAADVRVEPAAPAGPPGYRWVRVTATAGGRSASLVGLAKGDR